MSWWFTTSLLLPFSCLVAGFAFWTRRQRARFLKSERRRLAAEVESDRFRLRIRALEQYEVRTEELEAELADLRRYPARLQQRDAELARLDREIDRLGASVVSLTVEASRTGPLGIDLARTRKALDESRTLTGRLQLELVAMKTNERPPSELHGPRAQLGPSIDNATSWQDGLTGLGTPGANHYDDLKEIRGIGPVMERTLNSFGIHTWEQIAALTPADIERLSAALDTFPDRIRRDNWIGGAQELLAARRAPVTSRPGSSRQWPAPA